MTWLLIPFVVFAGSLIPLQAGVNASLRHYLSSPILAAVTNFSVGGLVLATYLVVSREPAPTWATLAKVPWWCWAGGAMGATLVMTGVLASHRLGAGTFIACIILGQLSASVALDHFGLVGYAQHAANPMRLVGIGLLVGGVYLIRTN